MIKLNGSDGFIIYQKPNTSKRFIGVGNWCETDSVYFNSPKFIFSTFDGKIFHLDANLNALKEEVNIYQIPKKKINPTKDEDYLKQAENIIGKCINGELQKCILSRVKNTSFNIRNPYQLFNEICNTYQHGFKYMLNHPKYGLLVGVSPETLICGDLKSGFHTHALAGSTPVNSKQKWTKKEKEEHQYVVDHIKNLIDKYGSLISESSTEEVNAGNVKHLNKDFRFKINEGILPFIRALHPTPAIAGTPTKKAIDFINKHEIHDRNLYCGYLGLISTVKAEIYVNLRCAEVSHRDVNLYVGGGITAKSNAQDEFKETEIKAETLLSVMKKYRNSLL